MLTLKLLIGPSYCGKSTWIKYNNFNCDVVLSTDSMRGAISGDESDQTQNYKVFDHIKAMARYYLYLGRNVIIDATNLSKRDRKDFLDIADQFKAKKVAIVFEFDKNFLVSRMSGRPRVVPEDVLDRQIAKYQPPADDEFDIINYV